MRKTPEQERQGKIFKRINEASQTDFDKAYDKFMKTEDYKVHVQKCIDKLNTKHK